MAALQPYGLATGRGLLVGWSASRHPPPLLRLTGRPAASPAGPPRPPPPPPPPSTPPTCSPASIETRPGSHNTCHPLLTRLIAFTGVIEQNFEISCYIVPPPLKHRHRQNVTSQHSFFTSLTNGHPDRFSHFFLTPSLRTMSQPFFTKLG